MTGGVVDAVQALCNRGADVWAANPVTLQHIEQARAGSRPVPGAWTTAYYAASLPKGRLAAAQDRLARIVQEAKRSSVLQAAIERAGSRVFMWHRRSLGVPDVWPDAVPALRAGPWGIASQ